MTAFSQRSIRLAMLDGIKQEDERTEQRLSERLRIKTAQLFHLHRELKNISGDLLIVQRQIASLADAIAIEEKLSYRTTASDGHECEVVKTAASYAAMT